MADEEEELLRIQSVISAYRFPQKKSRFPYSYGWVDLLWSSARWLHMLSGRAGVKVGQPKRSRGIYSTPTEFTMIETGSPL